MVTVPSPQIDPVDPLRVKIDALVSLLSKVTVPPELEVAEKVKDACVPL